MTWDAKQEAFRKDLTHLTWDEVYARQVKRASLVGEWMDALRLKSGDRLLEIGAGPGYVSLMLADRAGPTGIIYAVDRSADALTYLQRLQKERGISNIERLVADAATMKLADVHVDSALITMVLHHADNPPGILHNVARLLRPKTLAVVAEFHPDGPCDQGPPREHRVAPGQVNAWCEAAGFLMVSERRQTAEHYMTLVQRT